MEAKVILRHKEPILKTEPVKEPRDEKRGRLCITRYDKAPRNSVFIGDVEIEVVEIRNGQVRLGIYADKSIQIERKERLQRKKETAS